MLSSVFMVVFQRREVRQSEAFSWKNSTELTIINSHFLLVLSRGKITNSLPKTLMRNKCEAVFIPQFTITRRLSV